MLRAPFCSRIEQRLSCLLSRTHPSALRCALFGITVLQKIPPSSGLRRMSVRRIWFALTLIIVGTAAVLGTVVLGLGFNGWPSWLLMTASGTILSSLFWIWPRAAHDDAETAALRAELVDKKTGLREQTENFEQARAVLLAVLESRGQRLDERERDLVSRFARFHEFLEYPIEDVHAERTSGELQQLCDQDRRVRVLLEKEGERIYEKIRHNGYSVDGKLDVLLVRDEALQLVLQVAKIYKPNSENPLLETSFEQLARAASRICLHVLVLLEQLPVQVQQYSISTLYGYIRKAIVGYGMYQKAAPWLTYLSRGMYAGRMVATTNPLALGTWWLATEVGKRGAQKVLENAIDRQAISTLQELVTVIGIEVAGIYGTGIRQRDPAWLLGTELVELIHAFPASGDSLKHGLRQVTALPLRSEYDRIYLYRCLADHKSAGLQLADSAMLTREERESIAKHLEQFFGSHIHGATDANLKRWRDGFEQRFDLRLNMDSPARQVSTSRSVQIESAARSLSAFLGSVMTLQREKATETVKAMKTVSLLPEPQRPALLHELMKVSEQARYEPPELDPVSEITDAFLADLASCCTVSETPDEHIEQLVAETFSYFRRSVKDFRSAIESAWKHRVRGHCQDKTLADSLPHGAARAFFEHRLPDEQLCFCYDGLGFRLEDAVTPLADALLFGVAGQNAVKRGALVVSAEIPSSVLWQAAAPLQIVRSPGLLIDDARIQQGRWASSDAGQAAAAPAADLVISGSVRGGRYRTYFKELLAFGE